MYTNERVLGQIAEKIQVGGVDYPKTYQSLINDQHTNTILTNIQLRKQHMLLDPLAGKNPEPGFQSFPLGLP